MIFDPQLRTQFDHKVAYYIAEAHIEPLNFIDSTFVFRASDTEGATTMSLRSFVSELGFSNFQSLSLSSKFSFPMITSHALVPSPLANLKELLEPWSTESG